MTRASLLCLAIMGVACGPARHPTPGGLEVEGRLTPSKQAELDARHADLIACIPPTRKRPPTVRIAGECDRLPDGTRGRFGTDWVKVPPSLGAAAHEFAHYYTDDWSHTGWTLKCGDRIDAKYRREFPPKCEDK